jgi:hypothetical protein
VYRSIQDKVDDLLQWGWNIGLRPLLVLDELGRLADTSLMKCLEERLGLSE